MAGLQTRVGLGSWAVSSVNGPRAENAPTLTIDVRVRGGMPCVSGTGTTAEALADLVYAGDSVDATADDYGVTRGEVLLACWWAAQDDLARFPRWRRWRTIARDRLYRGRLPVDPPTPR